MSAGILLCATSNALAAVYKCKSPGGSVSYSDQPCPGALKKDGHQWISVAEEKRKAREEEEARQQAAKAKRERESRIYEAQRKNQAIREAQEQRRREQKIKDAKEKGLFVVEYVVEGSAGEVGITYRNASGGTEQHDVSTPWRKLLTVREGYFASISAQNQGKYGTVTVKILLNGIPVKSSESAADYGIASASGRI